MTPDPTETPPTHAAKQHAQFFKQSGWLMIANIIGGILTWSVHFLGKKIPDAEYSKFGVLQVVTTVLPTMPLQMIFAQQTARAIANGHERQLASTVRLTWLSLIAFWLVAVACVLIFQDQIIHRWNLGNAAPLWITLCTILVALLGPMLVGILQGKQDFFWIGWASILGGASRIGLASILVLAVGMGATGMIIGALGYTAIIAGIALWQSRDLWMLPGERFNVPALLKQILPLTFGFGACQFMFISDTIYATAFFTPDETAPYISVGTLSRALLWLVLPLAAVMFPKIVHSSAKSEKSNLMMVVLSGTALLAICGGVGLWLFGPIAVKLVGKAEWVVEAKVLLPWYAAAMVPLALANVLANDLLARGKFRVVPAMTFLAVCYGFALPYVLNHYPKKLEHILQTLAVFNFLLLCVCAWSSFRSPKSSQD
jgi:O-antigen/teichoic acid export membrane protein